MACSAPALYQDGFTETIAEAWGYHALQWEATCHRAKYNPEAAHPPTGRIIMYDEVALAENTADPEVFPDKTTGSWISVSTTDTREIAIAAALLMDRWESPAYVMMTIDGQSVPGVIRRVSFGVDSSSGAADLAELCDKWGWNAEGEELDIQYVVQSCPFFESHYLSVTRISISYWEPYLTDPSLRTTSGNQIETLFPGGGAVIGWMGPPRK